MPSDQSQPPDLFSKTSEQINRRTSRDEEDKHPIVIGPFRLLQMIGEGGMGEVWMAEQSAPVKRRVALKLIKRGLESKQVLARFESERQALALMNHPNIARILDAGTTDDGQPYFVMELVSGKPLTTYCDENRLSIEERLKLFIDVCAGVQHAHQKGIIHRDLKPSNILVGLQDGLPIPKVIDFGLAKALETTQKLTDLSIFTSIGQILGTFKYMSPEQAGLDTLDIDTRTDIYALGVILYELLTGTTPLDDSMVKMKAALKVLESIREDDPVRPSSKLGSSTSEHLSTITNMRRTDSAVLKRILVGDLDWIVMKALEKDRTRRYESASGFSADVRRFLQHEPVVARPPSWGYQLSKFVRKNRLVVISTLLVGVSLITGIAGTTIGLMRALASEHLATTRLEEANEARRTAESATEAKETALVLKEKALADEVRQRQYAQGVTEFLEEDLLELTSVEGQSKLIDSSSLQLSGKDTTLRELLDRAAEKLRVRKNLSPEVEARLCDVIGVSYRRNGVSSLGLPFLERAVQLRHDALGPDHPDTLTSMNNLAVAYGSAGQLDKSLQLQKETFEAQKSELGLEHPDTLSSLNNLAAAYGSAGQLDRALPLFEQALELRAAKLGADHPDTLMTMNNLASAHSKMGQLDKALALHLKAFELQKSKLGADHPYTLTSMSNLAVDYDLLGQKDKALPLFEESLRIRRFRFGPDHTETHRSMSHLALAYHSAGLLDKALPLHEETLALRKSALGVDHPDTLVSMNNLGNSYKSAGDLDRALALYEQTLSLSKTKLGPEHPFTLTTTNNLANTYAAVGQVDKAILLLEDALKVMKSELGADHPDTLTCMNSLATAYDAAHQMDKALPLFEETLRLRKLNLGPDHPDTLESMANQAYIYFTQAKFDKAIPLQEEALGLMKAKRAPDHPDTLEGMSNLAVAYYTTGQLNKSVSLLEEVLRLRKSKLGPSHPDTQKTMSNLADLYKISAQLDKAIPLLEELLRLNESKHGPDHSGTLSYRCELAEAYRSAGQFDKALPLFESAAKGLEAKNFQHDYASLIVRTIIEVFAKGDRQEDAARLQRRWLEFVKDDKGPESAGYALELRLVAASLLKRQNWQDALAILRECKAISDKIDPDEWTTFQTQTLLGHALLIQAKSTLRADEKSRLLTESESLLRSGYEGLKSREVKIPAESVSCLPEVLDHLVELYSLLENADEQEKYRRLRSEYTEENQNSERPN